MFNVIKLLFLVVFKRKTEVLHFKIKLIFATLYTNFILPLYVYIAKAKNNNELVDLINYRKYFLYKEVSNQLSVPLCVNILW